MTDVPVPRSLAPWLRMLWNIAPPLHALPPGEDGEATAPHLSPAGMHLPPAPAGAHAAAAHMAAHMVFSRAVFAREGTAPITQAITGVLEDARAEALAARELPGLRRLWTAQHTVEPAHGADFETLLLRLARALIDPAYADPHPWVRKGRALFWRDAAQQVLAEAGPRAVRRLASMLGHDLGQMRMAFNPRLYRPGPAYRDDNRWLWHSDEIQASAPRPAQAPPAPAAADPSAVRRTQPEWDHRIARLRRDWCTVHESEAPAAAMPEADPPAAPALVRALAAARRAPRMQARQALGDELDEREAVRLMTWLRSGVPVADARPYRRLRPAPRRAAALLLVDASASSSDAPAGGASALDRQCAQAAALARAMQAAGWRVAVQGFCSDGRARVHLRRVLDFGAPWDAQAAARLGGLRPGLSTRLGTVLRHAARALMAQPAELRWAVLLGDGEPHDIDVPDARYLPADARHAVRTARRDGVRCACLLPLPQRAPAAAGIFGPGAVRCAGAAGLPRTVAALLAG